MADYYSTGLTNFRAVPRVPNPPFVDGQILYRREDYVVPSGGIAAAKGIAMFKMYKNELFLGGWVAAESGCLDTGCVLQLGDGSDVDEYGEGSANDGDFEFGMTYALQFGKKIPADFEFTVTTKTGTAGLVAAKTLIVVVRYAKAGE